MSEPGEEMVTPTGEEVFDNPLESAPEAVYAGSADGSVGTTEPVDSLETAAVQSEEDSDNSEDDSEDDPESQTETPVESDSTQGSTTTTPL